MGRELDAAAFSASARRFLDGGTIGDASLREAATVGTALAVVAPDGARHSWFVPIVVGDRLAAFAQFLPNGAFLRFSSFARRPGEYGDCPRAEDWLDVSCIARRALRESRAGEVARDPVLTFDGIPDRVGWRVPLTTAEGKERQIFVTGPFAYAARA